MGNFVRFRVILNDIFACICSECFVNSEKTHKDSLLLLAFLQLLAFPDVACAHTFLASLLLQSSLLLLAFPDVTGAHTISCVSTFTIVPAIAGEASLL
jgi:hypothetical protein